MFECDGIHVYVLTHAKHLCAFMCCRYARQFVLACTHMNTLYYHHTKLWWNHSPTTTSKHLLYLSKMLLPLLHIRLHLRPMMCLGNLQIQLRLRHHNLLPCTWASDHWPARLLHFVQFQCTCRRHTPEFPLAPPAPTWKVYVPLVNVKEVVLYHPPAPPPPASIHPEAPPPPIMNSWGVTLFENVTVYALVAVNAT
jgi:hypothetical protein